MLGLGIFGGGGMSSEDDDSERCGEVGDYRGDDGLRD